jgi:CRISPR-associated protein Csm4
MISAICSAANKFYGTAVVESFLKPDAIKISSAYPFYNSELFFPKPLNYYPTEIEEYSLIKEFKKVKFISQDFLELLLQCKSINKSYLTKDYILNGCLRNYKNKNEDLIFKTNENPHIVLDRITNQTQIFYKTEVYFNKNAGLFFLADVNPELSTKFETVLRFLGDEGIGADRTIGKGLFEVELIENFSISHSGRSNTYYALSLYSPTEDEFYKIKPDKSFYDFEIRKGWVSYNTLRRKALRMFIEGSILNFENGSKPNGQIHKVLNKEDYPEDLLTNIFRSGQALFLPMNGGNNGIN